MSDLFRREIPLNKYEIALKALAEIKSYGKVNVTSHFSQAGYMLRIATDALERIYGIVSGPNLDHPPDQYRPAGLDRNDSDEDGA